MAVAFICMQNGVTGLLNGLTSVYRAVEGGCGDGAEEGLGRDGQGTNMFIYSLSVG
jgi:hypothetical protein